MSVETDPKKKHVIKALFYGAVTAGLYAAVFSHSAAVVEIFARGSYYAAFPIATVFVFSFAHGTFSSSLWSALGIEAVTKSAAKRKSVPAPRPAQRPRARLRISA